MSFTVYLFIQVKLLAALGGYGVGDMVRRMMRKLGTAALWSTYSLHGRRKKCFKQLVLCNILISEHYIDTMIRILKKLSTLISCIDG
jgi:hypothetical protein